MAPNKREESFRVSPFGGGERAVGRERQMRLGLLGFLFYVILYSFFFHLFYTSINTSK